MNAPVTLHTAPGAAALAQAAAASWQAALSTHPAHQPFAIALSGGRIPKALYQAFVHAQRAAPVPLDDVHFFWGDERIVPPDDPESNFRLADEGLLNPLEIPAAQIHRVRTEWDADRMVAQAEAALRDITRTRAPAMPVLDLVFLGMGEDGHIASLFPEDAEALVSSSVYRAVTASKPPPRRVTLGFPTLAVARRVWVLVSGQGKEAALRGSLDGTARTPLAHLLELRAATETKLFTDFQPAA